MYTWSHLPPPFLSAVLYPTASQHIISIYPCCYQKTEYNLYYEYRLYWERFSPWTNSAKYNKRSLPIQATFWVILRVCLYMYLSQSLPPISISGLVSHAGRDVPETNIGTLRLIKKPNQLIYWKKNSINDFKQLSQCNNNHKKFNHDSLTSSFKLSISIHWPLFLYLSKNQHHLTSMTNSNPSLSLTKLAKYLKTNVENKWTE